MDARMIMQGFHIMLLTLCVLYALKHGAAAWHAGVEHARWKRIVRDELGAMSPWLSTGERNIPKLRRDALAHTGMALLMLSTTVFNAFALWALAGGK